MSLDAGQLQRVQTIATFVRQAIMASQQNTEVGYGLAISALHDAIEHAFFFTLLSEHKEPKGREEFKELMKDTAEIYKAKTQEDMPFQRLLLSLNDLRKAFKHKGVCPSKSATVEHQEAGMSFLRSLLDKVHGIKIEEFHSLDVLRLSVLRIPLQKARTHLKAGDLDAAMRELAMAHHRLIQGVRTIFAQRRPTYQMSFDIPDFTKTLLDYVDDNDQGILMTAVLLSSGLDFTSYTYARLHIPSVTQDTFGAMKFHPTGYEPHTSGEVEQCLEQMALFATWIEQRFPTLHHDGCVWTRGVRSPSGSAF